MNLQFKVIQTGDGSGKGAALIAAIISRLAKEKEAKDTAFIMLNQKSEEENGFNGEPIPANYILT